MWSGREDGVGPDIGFLRLPPLNVGNLQATSTFLNLPKRRCEMVATEQPQPPLFHALAGWVEVWTSDLPPKQEATRLKEFRMLFGSGNVVSKYSAGQFDLCRFRVSFVDPLRPPISYGGVSGGGLWRVPFTVNESGQPIPREAGRLVVLHFMRFRHLTVCWRSFVMRLRASTSVCSASCVRSGRNLRSRSGT